MNIHNLFFTAPDAAPCGSHRQGRILIISGPSGSGKSTIYKKAAAILSNLEFSVSCTTRLPRQGERDGIDYHFISKDRFEKLLAGDAFAEHAEVHGNCYGTLKSELTSHIAAGIDVLLDIDVQGAAQIRQLCSRNTAFCGACSFVFIAPPSIGELRRRLVLRGTESEEVIARRIRNAEAELARASEYDIVIVNDDLEKATRQFIDFVNSQRSS